MLECVLVLSVLVFPQYPAMGRILSMPKTKTFEGDIGLTRSQMRSMQTDILFSGKIAPVNKWTNGKVPFTISEKYSKKTFKSTSERQIKSLLIILFNLYFH